MPPHMPAQCAALAKPRKNPPAAPRAVIGWLILVLDRGDADRTPVLVS
jgi:hypothetical protein